MKVWLWLESQNGVPSTLSRPDNYPPGTNEIEVEVDDAWFAHYEATRDEWYRLCDEVHKRYETPEAWAEYRRRDEIWWAEWRNRSSTDEG